MAGREFGVLLLEGMQDGSKLGKFTLIVNLSKVTKSSIIYVQRCINTYIAKCLPKSTWRNLHKT